jgi:hypothetical protein
MNVNDSLTDAEWASLLSRQANALHDQKPNAHERSGTEIERRIKRELQDNYTPWLVGKIAKRVAAENQKLRNEFASEHQKLRDEIEALRKDISGATTPTSPTVVPLRSGVHKRALAE